MSLHDGDSGESRKWSTNVDLITSPTPVHLETRLRQTTASWRLLCAAEKSMPKYSQVETRNFVESQKKRKLFLTFIINPN